MWCQDSSDSLFDLLCHPDPDKSLVIAPERIGNIARFLRSCADPPSSRGYCACNLHSRVCSGINNSKQSGRKKQNVRSIRFRVHGEMRVFLFASRDIRRGEQLYYDYNAQYDRYPTSHFC